MALFAGTELARRIEASERELVAAGTRALAARGVATALLPLAGGLAACSGPDSPFSKLVGLGFAGLPGEGELARVEAEFAARATPLQVELATLAEAGLAELLTRRGYVVVGFEDVLGRELAGLAPPRARAGLTLRTSPPEELETWLELLVEAFAAPDAQGVATHESFPREPLKRVMRALGEVRGLHRLIVEREDVPGGGAPSGRVPCGGASVRVDGELAQLCGAGTLPAHRRRGVQSALYEHCLALAAREGARLAIVTTLPGSKSQENSLRFGFEHLYTRAILRRGG